MAEIEQTRFLGASVVNFQSSIGWGRQPSTLTTTLVEDKKIGDAFNQPITGQPVHFLFPDAEPGERFEFGGIVQSWTQQNDESGNPLFTVNISDPRDILDGVQLILKGYYEDIPSIVPNLYNVYGYWEKPIVPNFGSSLANETGMPWQKIIGGFEALQAAGRFVSFKGYSYYVDFAKLLSLPLPSFYRVDGDAISMLGFIEDVCEASSRDFFITLLFFGGNSYITINTINRQDPPVGGRIQVFINGLVGSDGKSLVHSANVGQELRNEITNKFIVGAPIEEVYYNFPQDGKEKNPDGTPSLGDDTVSPYWGEGVAGDVIIGNGDFVTGEYDVILDAYKLNLPELGRPRGFRGSRPYNIQVPYHTDLNELRAAVGSQEAWEIFLWLHDQPQKFDDGKINIHYRKASEILKITERSVALKTLLSLNVAEIEAKLESDIIPEFLSLRAAAIEKDVDETLKRKIYDWLNEYARNYFGKKFMITVPFVFAKREPESLRIILTLEPTSSGFIPEENFLSLVAKNLLPWDVNKFLDENNKVVAYLRYDNFTKRNIDISKLNAEDFTVWNDKVFMKVILEPELVFRNKETFFSPRAVVTLPSPVYDRASEDLKSQLNLGILHRYLRKKGVPGTKLEKFYQRVGQKELWLEEGALPLRPDLTATPLKSNILTYGPWYTITGAQGKIDYSQDFSLAPWIYSSLANLNIVAQARVSQAYSRQQFAETGDVTFAGVPTGLLGSILISRGPYITDINVDMSESGALTTYRFKTWTWDFGKIGKFNEERFQKLNALAQQYRKGIRNLYVPADPKALAGFTLDIKTKLPKRLENASSHFVLFSDILTKTSEGNEFKQIDLVSQPMSDVHHQLKNEYQRRAAGTLDVLFRPFSTGTGDENLPHFESPSSTEIPTVLDLHPFSHTSPDGENSEGHDFGATITGSSIPSKGIVHEDGGEEATHRTLGIRMPAVLVGWGYDIDGKPVPNEDDESPGDFFLENFKRRMDKWKAGPLDVRWDPKRKVWAATGGACNLVRLDDNAINHESKGTVTTMKIEGGLLVEDGTENDVYNFTGIDMPSYQDCPQFFEMCDMKGIGKVLSWYTVCDHDVVQNLELTPAGLVLSKKKYALHDFCAEPETDVLSTVDCEITISES